MATTSTPAEQMAMAATFAGLGFGNAGVHIPHANAYPIAGRVRDFHPDGYPDDEPMVPHGMAVSLTAPEAFRFTFEAAPERHLRAASLLAPDHARTTAPTQLPGVLTDLMRDIAIPNGLGGGRLRRGRRRRPRRGHAQAAAPARDRAARGRPRTTRPRSSPARSSCGDPDVPGPATTDVAEALRRNGVRDVDDSALARSLYSTDASLYRIPPQVVVRPRDADEVAGHARGRAARPAPR